MQHLTILYSTKSFYPSKIDNKFKFYKYKNENNKLTFQTYPVENFHFQKAKQKFIELINS